MHEEYFSFPNVPTFVPGFWFMLKLKIFGKKIVERSGAVEAVWYAYKGKLYMTKYSAL
ncbi:MAG: hypothetical protein KGJ74_03800 [Betaproteobacteria bacterium]|nr:hypothetical protein [Betaproteobacteria bacterium]